MSFGSDEAEVQFPEGRCKLRGLLVGSWLVKGEHDRAARPWCAKHVHTVLACDFTRLQDALAFADASMLRAPDATNYPGATPAMFGKAYYAWGERWMREDRCRTFADEEQGEAEQRELARRES